MRFADSIFPTTFDHQIIITINEKND